MLIPCVHRLRWTNPSTLGDVNISNNKYYRIHSNSTNKNLSRGGHKPPPSFPFLALFHRRDGQKAANSRHAIYNHAALWPNQCKHCHKYLTSSYARHVLCDKKKCFHPVLWDSIVFDFSRHRGYIQYVGLYGFYLSNLHLVIHNWWRCSYIQ